MNNGTNQQDRSVKGMLLEFDLLQYQLECAENAMYALRLAADNWDSDRDMGGALYVVQSFLNDLSREQREWYETAKEAAGLK